MREIGQDSLAGVYEAKHIMTKPKTELGKMLKRVAAKKKAKVWHFCVIYPTAKIGDGSSIGSHCEIGEGVQIGERTRIGAGCFIPEGCSIGNDCFLGPRVTMMNDIQPPSPRSQWLKTVIKDGAVIGAACAILPGVTVGRGSMLGAGSVLTKNVPAGQLWYGNPARFKSLL